MLTWIVGPGSGAAGTAVDCGEADLAKETARYQDQDGKRRQGLIITFITIVYIQGG